MYNTDTVSIFIIFLQGFESIQTALGLPLYALTQRRPPACVQMSLICSFLSKPASENGQGKLLLE